MSLKDDFTGAFKQRDNALAQIILINIVLWLAYLTIQLFILAPGTSEAKINAWIFRSYLEAPSNIELLLYRPWTIITYAFLHSSDLFHILFNMLWFYIFGKLFKEYLGSDKLVSIYVLGAIMGVVAYLLLYNFVPSYANHTGLLVGASASVTAIVVATATLLPDYRFNLMFIGPVKIVYIALAMVLISYVRTISKINPGGNMAHLGGAAIGYFYIVWLRKGTDIGKWVTSFRIWVMNLFKPKPKVKVSYKSTEKKKTTSNTGDVSQAEIDLILDKISQSGYESLTKEEKQKLFNASKK